MSTLYLTPLPVLAVAIVVLMLLALEVGRRLNRYSEIGEKQLGAVTGTVLALAGLLLAFSFSMAADRYSQRRAAVVNEANAIETFWLRTDLIAEPIRSQMRPLMREYVELHFEHRAAGVNRAKLSRLEEEAARVQHDLWALMMEESRRDPQSKTTILTVGALNVMFDDTAVVLDARENRLPDSLLIVLLLMVVLASMVIGYGSRAEKRYLVLWLVFVVVLGGVLLILVDLDRPRRGLVRTPIKPYVRLREAMSGGD